MSKEKKKKKTKKKKQQAKGGDRVLNEILGILVITLSLLSAVCLFVGKEGNTLYALKHSYMSMLGYTAVIIPVLIGMLGTWLVWRRPIIMKLMFHTLIVGLIMSAWINFGLMLFGDANISMSEFYSRGGGAITALPIAKIASAILLPGVFMVLLASLLIYAKLSFNISYTQVGLKMAPYVAAAGRHTAAGATVAGKFVKSRIDTAIEKKRGRIEAARAEREREMEEKKQQLMAEEAARAGAPESFFDDENEKGQEYSGSTSEISQNIITDIDNDDKSIEPELIDEEKDLFPVVYDDNDKEETVVHTITDVDGEETIVWRLPRLDDWLDKNPNANEAAIDNSMKFKLEETLRNFQVPAKITNVVNGASFTRFELELEPGTKVSRIVTLETDIAIQLATDSRTIRIEAPIPGKSAVGIEVPNKERAMVPMRKIFSSEEFLNEKKPLSFILGEDIGGKAAFTNLVKMPHLLVAGSTNSGKSVCINGIITSIIAREFPSETRFIMVDMKRVELTPYDGIPHLLSPVIKEAQEAANALRWVCEEMERRYKRFAEVGVRDINGYNNFVDDPEEKMYRIVVIIDELADLMMVSSSNMNIENHICRITQLARATGIHVILATQRPDTKVITGTIKNNIPSRISFAVASQIDSRTVLDRKGAESLLGRGDMLFLPIDSNRMMRLQGAFVSDKEVKRLVKFWKDQGMVDPPLKFSVAAAGPGGSPSEGFTTEDEALYKMAVEIVVTTGQCSISMLQRRLRIGYNRSARLVDLMEERHVVGPYDGSKPREVILTAAGLDEV